MLKQSFCGSNNLKCGKFHNQVVEHMETKKSEANVIISFYCKVRPIFWWLATGQATGLYDLKRLPAE